MYFYYSMVVLIPAVIFGIWAQMQVKSTFTRYSKVMSNSGLSGKKLAALLLENKGLFSVKIESVSGKLSDHYDPRKGIIRLSQATYDNSSVAALGVVAHEIGHAVQHKEGYVPLIIRNFFVPVAQFGSSFSWIIFFIGLLMSTPVLIQVGIWLFLAVVVFSVITLPVEFDASKRGLQMLESTYVLNKDELLMAKKVLNAAAMTYVASTLMAVSQLIRMLMISNRN